MSNLPLQPLVWEDSADRSEAKHEFFNYRVIPDHNSFGRFAVRYKDSNSQPATGFATIEDAKAWAQDNYNEKMQPFVKPSPTWIDVSERLPEEDGLYSVYYPSGLIKLQTLFFSSNIKRFNLFHDSITHWMPLPELPELPELPVSKESDR